MSFTLIIVLSFVGSLYLYIGKKSARLLMMVDGIIMCTCPYFISNPYLLTGMTVVLGILPFIIPE